MGFQTEFNWVLKLDTGLVESDLEIGTVYDFSKNGCRIYPIDIPIDLINKLWEPVAKIMVLEVRNARDKTIGRYKVLKIYDGKEKQVLTSYWQETIQAIDSSKLFK